MKQKKEDRRSQRTQRLISFAMLELLFERRYEAITVQDILDRAGVGRSTFYTHYFDKEDVLGTIAEQMLEMFNQQFANVKKVDEIVPAAELFRHVQQNAHYFRAMLRGQAGQALWDAAQTALSKSIEQALMTASAGTQAGADSPSIPLAVVSYYAAGAFLSLTKWWIQADIPYTPEEMARIFQQLALPGVWATVARKPE